MACIANNNTLGGKTYKWTRLWTVNTGSSKHCVGDRVLGVIRVDVVVDGEGGGDVIVVAVGDGIGVCRAVGIYEAVGGSDCCCKVVNVMTCHQLVSCSYPYMILSFNVHLPFCSLQYNLNFRKNFLSCGWVNLSYRTTYGDLHADSAYSMCMFNSTYPCQFPLYLEKIFWVINSVYSKMTLFLLARNFVSNIGWTVAGCTFWHSNYSIEKVK